MTLTLLDLVTIPDELCEREQWVVWRGELRDGKTTKVPYRALDPARKASSTDPSTWATFDEATAVALAGIVDGIGYVFAPDDPYFGIDVDGLTAEERDWIVATLDSYTERSVSGTGLHVIGRGSLNGHGRHPKELGVFDRERYFVVTGDVVPGHFTIEDRQAELEAVLDRFMPAKPAATTTARPTTPIDLDDRELIERAFAARNGSDFQRLYGGDTSGYPSHSEADLALCCIAAFWTGRDPARVDAWLRSSGLMREKWERGEYRERTIEAAIAATNKVYEPRVANAERPTPSKPTVERMRLTRIADVTAKLMVWLEPELVALGMMTGLVAPGGTVKGLYGIHLAAKIAMRDERTLFLCSEDALDYIIRPRFDAAGCDGRLAFALSIESATGTRALHFPSDLPVLEAAIADVDPRLVIIDPVASYLDPGLDMAKNNQMREILQPLIALAAETNVAIVPVYHLGKERGRGAIGSVAFEDACRQVLTAARDDEDEDVRYVELTKSNIGRTGYGRKLRIVEVPLTIDGESVGVAKLIDEGRANKSVHALLEKKGPPGPEPEKRELARSALVDALIAGGTEGANADTIKKQVAEATAVSPSTVWRAFDELKKEDLAIAVPIRDESGSLREWKWVAKVALLVGRGDA